MALLLVGVCGALLFSAVNVGNYVKSRVKLHIYLERGIDAQGLAQAKDTMLTALSPVVPPSEISLTLITKEQAADDFKKTSGEDFAAFVGSNPLRDYYEVGVSGAYTTPEVLAAAQKRLAALPKVYEVTYLQDLANSLSRNLRVALIFLGSFGLILAIASAFLVSNTVRLQLFASRFLIRSMQLVGAKPGFVQRPFVARAFWLGLSSGVIAALLLGVLYLVVTTNVVPLDAWLSSQEFMILIAALLVLGAAIGSISSYFTVRRFLRLSLEKLS